jgi:succinate dehydrogenase hydrophobic anchor subunit
MGGIILLFLIIAFISFGIAAIVYNKLHKAGKNPWPRSITTFLVTAAILVFAIFMLFLYAFSFER